MATLHLKAKKSQTKFLMPQGHRFATQRLGTTAVNDKKFHKT